MIRFIVGLLMVFIGVGTMDTSPVAVGILGAGLYMSIAGLVIMAWGLRGMASKNSGYFYDEDNRQ